MNVLYSYRLCTVGLLPPGDNPIAVNSNNNNNNNNNNEMYDFTSNNWSYWNSNEKLKEKV